VTGIALAAVLVAYLVGSVPWGLILVRLAKGRDIRLEGSGNIGATNALRAGGVGLGLLTLGLDVGKGAAGYLAGLAIAETAGPPPGAAAFCLVVAPVAGHVFPPWLAFRGGKGVATALGVLAAVDWRMAAVASASFLALAFPTRMVSAGSLAAAAGASLFALWNRGPTPVALGVVAIAALLVIRHRENIQRIVAGTENRLGSRREQGRDE